MPATPTWEDSEPVPTWEDSKPVNLAPEKAEVPKWEDSQPISEGSGMALPSTVDSTLDRMRDFAGAVKTDVPVPEPRTTESLRPVGMPERSLFQTPADQQVQNFEATGDPGVSARAAMDSHVDRYERIAELTRKYKALSEMAQSDSAGQSMRDGVLKDYQDAMANEGVTVVNPMKPPQELVGKVVGPTLHRAGRVTGAALEDIAGIPANIAGYTPVAENLRSFANEPEGVQPTEQRLRESGGAGIPGRVGVSVAEMAPTIGASVALGSLGVPTPIANASVMAFDAQGNFNPIGVAAAAGIPFVDKLGRALTAKVIATQLGKTTIPAAEFPITMARMAERVAEQHPTLSKEGVIRALEFGGGQLANNAFLTALQLPGILSSENPKEAMLDSAAQNIGMSLMAAAHLGRGPLETATPENLRRVVSGISVPDPVALAGVAERNLLPATAEVLRAAPPVEVPPEPSAPRGATVPVPEPSTTIAAQLALTAHPESTKAVTLITPGAEVPAIPEGLTATVTQHGLAVYNPAKTTPEAVSAAGEAKDFDGTLLGMSQAAKPEPVGDTVVHTKTEAGVPALDEVVPNTPEAISAAMAAHAKAVPGGVSEVRQAGDVLAERKAPEIQYAKRPDGTLKTKGEYTPDEWKAYTDSVIENKLAAQSNVSQPTPAPGSVPTKSGGAGVADVSSQENDPNIGRTWTGTTGQERILSVEKGKPEYGIDDLYNIEDGKGAIYRISGKSLNDWIKRREHETTPEYAQEQVEQAELNKSRAERDARQKAKEEQTLSEIEAFTNGLTPIQSGKIRDALQRLATFNGKTSTRKEFIEAKVKEGYRVTTENGKRIFKHPSNGSFWHESSVTKTGMDYADYLANKDADLTPAKIGKNPTAIDLMEFVKQLSTGDIISSGDERWFVIKRPEGVDLFAATDGSHRYLGSDGTWASDDVDGFDVRLSPAQIFTDALPEPAILKSGKALTEREGEDLVGTWSDKLDKSSTPNSGTKTEEAKQISRSTAQITNATTPQTKALPATAQITVQPAEDAGNGEMMPGYVQVDFVEDGKNTRSTNPETLRAEGYDVPDFTKLPKGKYGVGEAGKMVEAATGEKAAKKTRLDLIFDEVEKSGEVTIRLENTPTREFVQRVTDAATARGLDVSFDGSNFLIRRPIRNTPTTQPAVGSSEPAAGSSFRDWRVQGTTVRHSRVGQKLTAEQAASIMDLMQQNGMLGRYDTAKGTVVLNSGVRSDLESLWHQEGSQRKVSDKQESDRQEIEARRASVENARTQEVSSSPSAKWIDETFGSDAMNNFNKLELVKYLEGKTDKFGGGTSNKWQAGLSKIGATTLPEVREAYQKSIQPPVESPVKPVEAAETSVDAITPEVAKYQRKSPAKGTPERAALEAKWKEFIDLTEPFYKQLAELQTKRDAQAKYSKAREATEKKIQKLQEQRNTIEAHYKDTGTEIRLAHQEDKLNSPNPVVRLKAMDDLGLTRGGRSGYDRVKEIVEAEAKRQGATDDEAKSAGMEAYAYTVDEDIPLAEIAKRRIEGVRADARKRSAHDFAESLTHLNAFERQTAKRTLEGFYYDPERFEQKKAEFQKQNDELGAREKEARDKVEKERAESEMELAVKLRDAGTLVWRRQAGQNEGETKWGPVEGKAVKISAAPKHQFSVYNGDKGWVVIENSTGLAVGSGKTKTEAVANTNAKLTELGPEKFAGALKKNLKDSPPPEKPTLPEAAEKTDTTKGETPVSMGGQNPADTGEIAKAELAQLAESLKGLAGEKAPKVSEAFNLGEKFSTLKDGVSSAVSGLKAAAQVVKERLINKPVVDKWITTLGNRHLALSESAINARRFTKSALKTVPDPVLQEAISNWIDTGGDPKLLADAAEKSPARYKAGYERALKLSPDEITIAENIRNYFESRLQDAIDAGILEAGLEDFIHRLYETDTPWKNGVLAELRSGLFTGKPGLAKKRVFQYDFEAEQAGLKPIKSFVKRVAAYDLALNKAIADRQAVKEMMGITMPDGRPMIDVAGIGAPTGDEEKGATLIKPHWKLSDEESPENNRSDYKPYDHPSLRKWKWAGTDENGNPILFQGDVLVHPDALSKVKVLFERSAIRANPVGRLALNLGSMVKQTMLDLSGFHFAQITVHGWEHRSFKPVSEIDFTDPNVRGLIRGGLVVGETSGRELFHEGLSGSSLTKHIPYLGPKLHALTDYLFSDYIPRLKVATGLHALERNRARFPNLTEDELHHMTASQMNAAFGELNYAMLGRSQTMQDALRLALLAPDFLEARSRFVGQAATKYGREQFTALAFGAVALYLLARILNKTITGEYHMEPKNAFSVVYNKKAYGLRTVQGDIIHLLTEPARFMFNRLNPVYGRTALEYLTERDQFGRKRSLPQQMKDAAATIVPISMRGVLHPREQNLWESFLNAFGFTNRRSSASTRMFELAKEFREKNKIRSEPGEFIYDAEKDPFRDIRQAAMFSDADAVASEIDKALKKGDVTKQQIEKHFENYRNHAFVGSQKMESKFVQSLSEDDKLIYNDAKKERQDVWRVYLEGRRKR